MATSSFREQLNRDSLSLGYLKLFAVISFYDELVIFVLILNVVSSYSQAEINERK